jgi:hypothetical protein
MSRVVTRIVIAASVAAITTHAAAQSQIWIRQFGSTEADEPRAVCTDGAGGVFVAGRTEGSLGGPNAGFWDPWLARYDGNGNQIWIRQFGTVNTEYAVAACSDGLGGVFVVGPGNFGAPDVTSPSLVRYDSAGNRIWIRQIGPGDGLAGAAALCSDGRGGAFVGGRTFGSLGGPNAGELDAWLARYDSEGNQIWIRQFGTSANEGLLALSADGVGGAFAAGGTEGNLGGPVIGSGDVWLARYDGAGTRTWLRQFGGFGGEQARALSPDGVGGVFVAGETNSILDGGHAGGQDAWLARYDGAGNRAWLRQFGTLWFDSATGVAGDGVGGAYILWNTSINGVDMSVAHYDSVGRRMGAEYIGFGIGSQAFGMSPDGAGGAFLVGSTGGSLGGPNAGVIDAWLARYGPSTCKGDFNLDGTVDFFDYLDFVGAWDDGC